MRRIRYSCAAVLIAGATVFTACGETPSRVSPVAPELGNIAGAQSSSSLVTAGSRWATRDSSRLSAAVSSLVVEGTDLITAVTGTCPSVVITVRDTPVIVNTTTVFGTGTTCAGLVVGANVHVTGVLTIVGGTATVTATNISIVSTATSTPTVEEVTGTVVSKTGTCPAVTITLDGTNGTVVTSSSTTFTPADSCATIAAGLVIEAHGTRNASQQLVATDVTVEQNASAGVPVGHGHNISGEGTVANVTGTCPALSMVIRGVHVTTSAETAFLDGTCSAIRNGTTLVVLGVTQDDGRVAATSVRITRQHPGKGHS
jgi:uncharacterized protein DUF5666